MFTKLLSNYYLIGVIGEGTYGVVYKARRLEETNPEKLVAIKRIKPTSNELERPSITSISTLREISLLRELNHKNIVRLTDVIVDPKGRDVAIVMEFAHLTLEGVLKEHRNPAKKLGKLPEFMCKSIMYQCLKGLEFMHKNWVLHRDLKPQNILIVQYGENRGLLQLADLGLARIFQNPIRALGKVDKTVVTLWYRAPELLLGANHYTTAVDVWSMGCIFAELFFADSPQVPPALFAGKQERQTASGNVFEKDQCRQIFQVLGMPSAPSWPDVNKLPQYQNLEKLREQQGNNFPSSSVLSARMNHFSSNMISRAALGLLADTLELNPSTRISATAALNHQYFEKFKTDFKPHQLMNALDDPSQTSNRRSYEYPIPKTDELSPRMKKLQEDMQRPADAMHRKRQKLG